MTNIFIGEPLDVLKEYLNRSEYRSLQTMSEEECTALINMAIDNGNWNGITVNYLKISEYHSNFIEGNVSFGGNRTYYFSIRYDGTIDIHQMVFDEAKTMFRHSDNKLQIYNYSRIIFYMMKCGFDLISDLK